MKTISVALLLIISVYHPLYGSSQGQKPSAPIQTPQATQKNNLHPDIVQTLTSSKEPLLCTGATVQKLIAAAAALGKKYDCSQNLQELNKRLKKGFHLIRTQEVNKALDELSKVIVENKASAEDTLLIRDIIKTLKNLIQETQPALLNLYTQQDKFNKKMIAHNTIQVCHDAELGEKTSPSGHKAIIEQAKQNNAKNKQSSLNITKLEKLCLQALEASKTIRSDSSSGAMTIGSDLNVCGNESVSGDAAILGQLNVSGISTFFDDTFVSGNLQINGSSQVDGNASVNGALQVNNGATINNDTLMNGNLNVSGSSNLNGSLNVTGPAQINNDTWINGALNIAGNTHIDGGFEVHGPAQMNSNASISGSLAVDGIAQINNSTWINGALDVAQYANIGDNLQVNGSANILGSMSVGGPTQLNNDAFVGGNFGVANNTNLNGYLQVNGTSSLNNDTFVGGLLNVIGQTSLNNNAAVGGSLSVAGTSLMSNDAAFGNNVTISGNEILGGDLTVYGLVNVNNNAAVGGELTINGAAQMNNNASVNGALTVQGAAQVNNDAVISGNLDVGGTLNVANSMSLSALSLSGPLSIGATHIFDQKKSIVAIAPWPTEIIILNFAQLTGTTTPLFKGAQVKMQCYVSGTIDGNNSVLYYEGNFIIAPGATASDNCTHTLISENTTHGIGPSAYFTSGVFGSGTNAVVTLSSSQEILNQSVIVFYEVISDNLTSLL